MQRGTEQLKRQQLILYVKGFYTGKIDGIWSAKTIDAKKRWEALGKPFAPGLPNNGLPFADRGPYPKGLSIGKDKLLTCFEVEEYIKMQAEDEKSVPTEPDSES